MAHRQYKLSTYDVVIIRDVEFRKTLKVQARTTEEAEDIARNMEESMKSLPEDWIEHPVAVTIKAKINRSKT